MTTATVDNFIFYSGENGQTHIKVAVEDDTVWMTQAGMTEAFDVAKSTVSEHLTNIFKSAELDEKAVVRKIRTTAADGKNYNTAFYNLDAIISVGYQQFRPLQDAQCCSDFDQTVSEIKATGKLPSKKA